MAIDDMNGKTVRKTMHDPGKTFDYGKNLDLFAVHNGFDRDESFLTNEMAGDLVLDISTKGRVRGIEVFNASRFFGRFGVDASVFDNLVDADLQAEMAGEKVELQVLFKTAGARKVPARITIPFSSFDKWPGEQ